MVTRANRTPITEKTWNTDRGTEPTLLLWGDEPWEDINRWATDWDNILVSPWYSVTWGNRSAISAPSRWSRTQPTTIRGSRSAVTNPTWNNRTPV